MGAADVVPGVSGGTIAFITGIYERLLNAIKSFSPDLVPLLKEKGVKHVLEKTDTFFLLALFGGIATSILSLAKGLKWCLATYPQLLWAFFFGLIIASIIYMARQIDKWNAGSLVGIVIGAVVAYTITLIAPAEASTASWAVFGAGAIAICAMILPGISGSFILLLMGMYPHVIDALHEKNISFLAIFAGGCATGLLLFSHVLSWTFNHHKTKTMAVLTGFMIGSLNKVWPWQNVLKERANSKGEMVPFLRENVLPAAYTEGEPYFIYCLLLVGAGFILVLGLEFMGIKTKKDA